MSKKRKLEPTEEFERTFRELVGGVHRDWKVFADFCEMAAISLAGAPVRRADREERYRAIRESYSTEERKRFPELLGLTVMGLGTDMDTDFLGSLFMKLELGSHWHGQFFTPMDIARMMAEMTLRPTGIQEEIERKGYITLSDPAAGAGATIIAAAGAMRRRGFNPQRQLHVTAIDIDATAAHMCYIQLALLGIPAVVHVGNTLSMEMRDSWYTPFHHLGFWSLRVGRSMPWNEKRRQEEKKALGGDPTDGTNEAA